MNQENSNVVSKRKNNCPTCTNCNGPLMHLMPSGKILHCTKCKKYFVNDNGKVGKETTSPYTNNQYLY